MKLPVVTLMISTMIVSGCSVSCLMQYGNVREYGEISLSEINQTQKNFNVQGFILGIVKCPEEAICFAPDGIVIGESPTTKIEEGINLFTDCPEVFDVGKKYTFSFENGKGIVGYAYRKVR